MQGYIERGILPILVIYENNDTSNAFLLEKRNFNLIVAAQASVQEDQSSVSSNVDHDVSNKAGQAGMGPLIGGAVTTMFVPIVGVPLALVGSIIHDQANIDALVITQNMQKKEFQDVSIYPGKLHNGFLYFQIKNQDFIKQIVGIQLNVKEIQTSQALMFRLYFKKE